MTDPVYQVEGPVDPDHVVEWAKGVHLPSRAFCLFSGGNDSTAVAHRMREHYDALVHIDTGTALPGVREHVEQMAVWIGKPLRVYEAGDAYRNLVLHLGGFPGPAGHARAYQRLKERQIEALVRDVKGFYQDRVMLLSGKRRDESARRSRTSVPVSRRGCQLYVAPLIDWTNTDLREYRLAHAIPQSDVAALIHRSGECNCGAFAAPGEREELRSLWPEWFEANIASLEREAEVAGVRACRWGERPPSGPAPAAGPLCTDCVWNPDQARRIG